MCVHVCLCKCTCVRVCISVSRQYVLQCYAIWTLIELMSNFARQVCADICVSVLTSRLLGLEESDWGSGG